MARWRWMVLGALVACGPQVIDQTDDTGGTTVGDPTAPTSTVGTTTLDPADSTGVDPTTTPSTRAVDVLFVVDNSGTMGEAQGRLAAAAPGFVAALDGLGLDWRIGVTTTDNGNPWCGSTAPEAGKMVDSSCRSRTGEFVFNGNPPADATAVACTDVCTLDSLELQPTATALDPELRARPWLEPANVPAGVDASDALACMLPQGLAGCGFEAPLESGYKALLRAHKDSEREYGFLRDDALFVLVIVTDEADCSYNNDHQSIFLPASMGGSQVFWTDPDAAAPTSAVCWNAGVSCTGVAPFDECHAENKSVDGAEGVPDNDAVLHPVSRYVDFLAQLQLDKQTIDPAARVLVAVIGGVPPGYVDGAAIPYAPSGDPQQQLDFGIGPACTQPDGVGFAVPAVRDREVAEAFTSDGSRNLWSICDPGYDGALAGIAAMIDATTGG